jgi:hypothetical protein
MKAAEAPTDLFGISWIPRLLMIRSQGNRAEILDRHFGLSAWRRHADPGIIEPEK